MFMVSVLMIQMMPSLVEQVPAAAALVQHQQALLAASSVVEPPPPPPTTTTPAAASHHTGLANFENFETKYSTSWIGNSFGGGQCSGGLSGEYRGHCWVQGQISGELYIFDTR